MEGGGGAQESFVRRGADPMSNPLFFLKMPFSTKKVTLPYTFHFQMVPLKQQERKKAIGLD